MNKETIKEWWEYLVAGWIGLVVLLTQLERIAKVVKAIWNTASAIAKYPVRVIQFQDKIVARLDGVTSVLDDLRTLAASSNQKATILLDDDKTPRFECDPNGKCIWVNRALCNLFGLERQEMLGYGWLTAVVEEDAEDTRLKWNAALAGEYPYKVRYRITNQKTLLPVLCEATADFVRDHNGKILSVIGRVHEVKQ